MPACKMLLDLLGMFFQYLCSLTRELGRSPCIPHRELQPCPGGSSLDTEGAAEPGGGALSGAKGECGGGGGDSEGIGPGVGVEGQIGRIKGSLLSWEHLTVT